MKEKIEATLNKKFPEINNYSRDEFLLLYGNELIEIMKGNEANVLRFVLLTQEKIDISDFFDTKKLTLKHISEDRYEINKKEVKIYITVKDDLLELDDLGNDLLFYDIRMKQLIPIGSEFYLEHFNPNKKDKKYCKNLIKFKKNIIKSKYYKKRKTIKDFLKERKSKYEK